MTRLVVVSNRVAPIDESRASAGGLAVAILAALKNYGGMWFGWSGEVVGTLPPKPTLNQQEDLTYATIDLTRRDYAEYYAGFANSTVWPLFHYRLDLTTFDRRYFTGYMRVNNRFARNLFPLLRTDDILWVHDYHLMPLGGELKRFNARQPMGFFLHTPFPVPEILLALPRHRELVEALCAYDLIGFQTVGDLSAFHDYIVLEGGGEVLSDGVVHAFGQTVHTAVFPIGIDTEAVEALADAHDNSEKFRRLKQNLQGRALIVGVDRLDYSKGLVQRFQSFERLLENHPDNLGKVTLMQIAPPSREDVRGYSEIRHSLETAAGHINGRFADFDWVPIHYLNKSFDRAELACFLRASRIGLVTPLRDGMNLVAKEYVASQKPSNPGVLVLSRFAGAARELESALIVNPYDIDEVSNALRKGLEMPLGERRQRWNVMMQRIRGHDVYSWREDFLGALEAITQMA